MAALPVYGNSSVVRMEDLLDSWCVERLDRKLSVTPPHLSRVIYISKYKDGDTHLPLYDVSETYHKSFENELVGSNKYKLKLAMMRAPTGDGTSAEVRYLVDLEHTIHETVASVKRRTLGGNGETVNM
ncbi:hypothetical protein CCHL11_03255 [Colletotrichum chlorophyti]|uniref:Uncharacterized protein n=1 Tax=Colletotrichum chlorophyti TaxID=708187 RepID=A0A1Q8S3S4_9PEZI|nr:hypothetical protein CCHL11_03255 [Colletotrichum chlorophyti]